MRLLLICLLPLGLTQCVDPYGNPMSPFGPATPPAYTDGREQYRTDMREQDRMQNQQAYERGQRDDTDDARSGQPRGSQRNPFGYSTAQGNAYNEGYEQAYRANERPYAPPPAPAPGYGAGGYNQAPSYPGDDDGGYPPPSPGYPPPGGGGQSDNDPAYNQGYDYGVRDRVAGRQADAGAHVGRYDPRHRRSFERGYYDAFESRR